METVPVTTVFTEGLIMAYDSSRTPTRCFTSYASDIIYVGILLPSGGQNASFMFKCRSRGNVKFATVPSNVANLTLSNSEGQWYYAVSTSFYRAGYTFPIQTYNSLNDFLATRYPITYHYTNSTVSGPTEAAVGDTVTVSAVPNENYGITDAASQILVTNNDVAVPYVWDSATNTITFTMPDPS